MLRYAVNVSISINYQCHAREREREGGEGHCAVKNWYNLIVVCTLFHCDRNDA